MAHKTEWQIRYGAEHSPLIVRRYGSYPTRRAARLDLNGIADEVIRRGEKADRESSDSLVTGLGGQRIAFVVTRV